MKLSSNDISLSSRKKKCIFTKSVLHLSDYSQYSWWSPEPILLFSEWFISTWYFSWNKFSRFWWAVRESYPQRSELAFRILLSLQQYISARGFFCFVAHIKTKARNQRIVELDKRLARSNTYPRISKLSIRLQSQPWHWICLQNVTDVWN